MNLLQIARDDLVLTADLTRSGSVKQFQERLRASIDEIGLVEPLKVAPLPNGKYLVIDGTLRLNAIDSIRRQDARRFAEIDAYVVDYSRRYEIRYQSDIYQDLLPSQLAALVEHLHKAENVLKADIARYIGVSPATLRNYTGLWRLLQRGGLFARIVDLMDAGVIPASNPYAWLRLTAAGLRNVIETSFSEGERAETWIERSLARARHGDVQRFPIKLVEAATDALPPEQYRVGAEVRSVKRTLGQRRAGSQPTLPALDFDDAYKHLSKVSRTSSEPVLRLAAKSLLEYLQ